MSEQQTVPEWLEVGQPVAVVGGFNPGDVNIQTVKRFTQTRVVLDNDSWFPLARLSKRYGGTWGHLVRLEDANAEHIVRAVRVQQIRNLARQVGHAAQALPAKPTDEQLANIAALAQKLARRATP